MRACVRACGNMTNTSARARAGRCTYSEKGEAARVENKAGAENKERMQKMNEAHPSKDAQCILSVFLSERDVGVTENPRPLLYLRKPLYIN